MIPVRQAVADAHRREWAALLAATVRVTRDLDLAEECVQDAYAAALDAWTRDGVPERPGAWLTVAARHNALDALRRSKTLRAKLPLLVEPESGDGDATAPAARDAPDDRLRLVFLCCHPELSREAQVALTLRLVCGVATPVIAGVFLVSEPTMAARVTRAKKKVRTARIPFRVPDAAELPARLDAVLTTVHLLFTAGHTAPRGPGLVDDELAERAVDLARMLDELMPGRPEVQGLLALVLANHARRATRADTAGRPLLLADQDRSAWDREAIAEAHALVTRALRARPAGRFTLQAAIAVLHATAPTYDATDWPRILDVYDALSEAWPSPVVALNRAVAVAMVHGPERALDDIATLEHDGRLADYHYLPAVKADLLRRTTRPDAARAAAREYEAAIALTGNDAERAFLAARLAETRAGIRADGGTEAGSQVRSE